MLSGAPVGEVGTTVFFVVIFLFYYFLDYLYGGGGAGLRRDRVLSIVLGCFCGSTVYVFATFT